MGVNTWRNVLLSSRVTLKKLKLSWCGHWLRTSDGNKDERHRACLRRSESSAVGVLSRAVRQEHTGRSGMISGRTGTGGRH